MGDVKLRREKDLKVLKNPDLGVDEVWRWIQELFVENEMEFVVPEDILEYGMKLMKEHFAKAKDTKIRHMVLRKILHTQEVMMAGREILVLDKSEVWEPAMIDAVTFAHDFGRFPQAHLGSYSDFETGFDHAKAGAELILAGNFKDTVEIKRLAEAVREHSKLEYLGDDKYGKFIRDADKLGLISFFHYHIEEIKVPNGSVTPGAIKAFLEEKLVLKKDLINRIDVFLCWLSWGYDLNYQATKELFVNGGTKEYILGEIKKMDPTVLAIVEDKLDSLLKK